MLFYQDYDRQLDFNLCQDKRNNAAWPIEKPTVPPAKI